MYVRMCMYVCMVSNVSIGIKMNNTVFYSEAIFFLSFCNLWIISCQHDKFTTPSLTFCTGWEGVGEGDYGVRITVDPLEGLLVSFLWLERKLHSRGKGERCSINSAVNISDVGMHWSEGKFGLVGGGGGGRKGEGGEEERKRRGRGRRPGRRGGRRIEEEGEGKLGYTDCFVSIAIAMDTVIAMDTTIAMDITIDMDTLP